MNPSTKEKLQGAFLGCALGDALGRPFESSLFSDARLIPLVERRASQQDPWAYSDDTQMMCSVAESLLQQREIDPEHLIRTLAKNYDPSRGYGKGMKLVFQALERGLSWQEAANSSWAEGSKGNGAAVRIAPIAFWYREDPEAVRAAVRLSASVSHTHPSAQVGASLQAAALAFLFSNKTWDPQELLTVLAREAHGDAVFQEKIEVVSSLYQKRAESEEAVRSLGNGSSADESVPLSLFMFLRCAPDVERVVKGVIQCGGDTDSSGALCGALVGALVGVNALPSLWLANLEGGRRGRDYLLSLADELSRAK